MFPVSRVTSYSALHLEVLRSLICWSGLSPGIIKMTGRTLMRVLRYTENAPNLAIEEHRKPLNDTVARIMQPRSFQGEHLTEPKRMPAHRAASSDYVGELLPQYGSNTPPSSSTFFVSFSTCNLTGRAAYPSTSIPHPLPFPDVE